MRRTAVAALLGVCASIAFACSTFDADDGGGGGTTSPDASSDGAAADTTNDAALGADVEADAEIDADSGASSNVVFTDDFNATSAGSPCDKWVTMSTTAIVFDGGRTGRACLVCPTGSNGSVYKTVSSTVFGTYTTLMYVHAGPDASAAQWAVASVYDDDAGLYNTGGSYNTGDLSPSWELAQAVAADVQPFSKVGVRIYTTGNPGECLLVDDVVLTR